MARERASVKIQAGGAPRAGSYRSACRQTCQKTSRATSSASSEFWRIFQTSE